MGPVLAVVIESFDFVNFVFCFNVSVFGHTDIGAYTIFIEVFPIDTTIDDCFVRTINSNAGRPCSPATILACLVTPFIKITDPRKRFTEVTDLVVLYTTYAIQ